METTTAPTAKLFTTFGNLRIRVLEGTDLLDGFSSFIPKNPKKTHHVISKLEVFNEENMKVKAFTTEMQAYADGFLDIRGEEYLFENVLSSFTLILSLHVAKDGPQDNQLEYTGMVSIPISRLEEDTPVIQWYQLVAPTETINPVMMVQGRISSHQGQGLRSAIRLDVCFLKSGPNKVHKDPLHTISTTSTSASQHSSKSNTFEDWFLAHNKQIGSTSRLDSPLQSIRAVPLTVPKLEESKQNMSGSSSNDRIPVGLIDYCLVIGPSSDITDHVSPYESRDYNVSLWDRYPTRDHMESPLPPKAEWFACPEGFRTISSSEHRPPPTYSSFVMLTGAQGDTEQYDDAFPLFDDNANDSDTDPNNSQRVKPVGGGQSQSQSHNWIGLCLCLLSRGPFIMQLWKCLHQAYFLDILPLINSWEHAGGFVGRDMGTTPGPRLNLHIEKLLVMLALETPVPIPGHLKVVLRFPSNLTGFAFLRLPCGRPLSIPGTTIVCETLRALMYPFRWGHVYVPVVPAALLDLVEAPVPFILGVLTELLIEVPLDYLRDVVLVDCDNGVLDCGRAPVARLPEPLDRWLVVAVRMIMDRDALMEDRSPKSTTHIFFGDDNGDIGNGDNDVYIHDNDDHATKTATGGHSGDSGSEHNSKKSDMSCDRGRLLQLVVFDVIASMLGPVPECLFFLDSQTPIFNRPLFLQEFSSVENRSFLEALTDTHAFQAMTASIQAPSLSFFLRYVERSPYVNISPPLESKLITVQRSTSHGDDNRTLPRMPSGIFRTASFSMKNSSGSADRRWSGTNSLASPLGAATGGGFTGGGGGGGSGDIRFQSPLPRSADNVTPPATTTTTSSTHNVDKGKTSPMIMFPEWVIHPLVSATLPDLRHALLTRLSNANVTHAKPNNKRISSTYSSTVPVLDLDVFGGATPRYRGKPPLPHRPQPDTILEGLVQVSEDEEDSSDTPPRGSSPYVVQDRHHSSIYSNSEQSTSNICLTLKKVGEKLNSKQNSAELRRNSTATTSSTMLHEKRDFNWISTGTIATVTPISGSRQSQSNSQSQGLSQGLSIETGDSFDEDGAASTMLSARTWTIEQLAVASGTTVDNIRSALVKTMNPIFLNGSPLRSVMSKLRMDQSMTKSMVRKHHRTSFPDFKPYQDENQGNNPVARYLEEAFSATCQLKLVDGMLQKCAECFVIEEERRRLIATLRQSRRRDAREILSILLQTNSKNQKRLGNLSGVDGMDLLLEAVSIYRKKDPTNGDEEECVQNLFLCLCTALMCPDNQSRFRQSEGFELMMRCLKEQKYSACSAVKVIDYAIANNKMNCERLVECGALKIYDSTVKDASARLLMKFIENEYEKVERCAELFIAYSKQLSNMENILEQKKLELIINGE
eukprot:gene3873-7731_t